MRGLEERLSATSAILKGEPEDRRTNDFSQSGRDIFRSFFVGNREAVRRSDHERCTELKKGAATETALQHAFVDRL
jgi:hypothetical protein